MSDRVNPMVPVVAAIFAILTFVVGFSIGLNAQVEEDVPAERSAMLKDLKEAEQMICTKPPTDPATVHLEREQCVGAGMMRAFVWARLSYRDVSEAP